MAENKEKINISVTRSELNAIISCLMLEKQTLEFLRGWGATTIKEQELGCLAERFMKKLEKDSFNNVCR